MDPSSLESLKVLIGAFGGSGLAFFAAWAMFKSWKDSLKENAVILTARITKLEENEARCLEAQDALHRQIFDLQQNVIAANTEVLHRVAGRLDVARQSA